MQTKEILLSIIKGGKWTSLRVKDYIPATEAEDEQQLSLKLPMTSKQYAQMGGARCPFCGNEDIVGSSFNWEAEYLYQDLTCNVCLEDWADEYRLVGYIPDHGHDAG